MLPTRSLLLLLVVGLVACGGVVPPPHGQPLREAEVAGRRFWVMPGPLVTEDHPCCGVVPANLDRASDAEAVCPPVCAAGRSAGDDGCACPAGTTALKPGLADDRVCGAPSRCVRLPELRVDGSSPLIDLTTGATYPPGGDWAIAEPDPAGVVEVMVPDGTRALLLLSPGWRYRVSADDGQVTGVIREGRVPASPN